MRSSISILACMASLILVACGGEPKSDLPPQPPMWVVSDADSEVTLYPTLHILPPETVWKSEALTDRLNDAEEVWFEILPGSESDPALQQMMMGLGLNPGSSLSTELTEAEVTALKSAIEPLGMPFQVVDQMRPWVVSTFVGMAALTNAGFDLDAGVEKQLVPMSQGKTIRALETAEEQMKMLASFSNDVQIKMLKESLTNLDDSVDDLTELVDDWAKGDVEDLEKDLLEEMKHDNPDVFEALFTRRNQNWADQIETEMKGSGTDFIAVGAGHLVGQVGVPAILRARGYAVNRL